jgi:hypothetical protein
VIRGFLNIYLDQPVPAHLQKAISRLRDLNEAAGRRELASNRDKTAQLPLGVSARVTAPCYLNWAAETGRSELSTTLMSCWNGVAARIPDPIKRFT